MNWDAIGSIAEMVGSIAVLTTLIYLSIQLRKTQLIAESQSIDTSRLFELEQSNQLIAHAELIEKANRNEDLSVVEERVLNTLLNARARNSFLHYVSSDRLQKGDKQYLPSQLANFIARNPGFHPWWSRFRETVNSQTASEMSREFFTKVDELVERFKGST